MKIQDFKIALTTVSTTLLKAVNLHDFEDNYRVQRATFKVLK